MVQQGKFPEVFFCPRFFDWAECDCRDGHTLGLLDGNGAVETVALPVVSYEEYAQSEAVYAENYEPLPLLWEASHAEYIDAENGGCVYLPMSDLMSESTVRRLIREAATLFEAHPACEKLAVDFRQCVGGNAEFVRCFREDTAQSLREKRTFALTGGWSASAVTVYIAYFKSEAGAVTVGEATGQFSSFFHMQSSLDKPVVLPHSQITVMLSNAFWDSASDMPRLTDTKPFQAEYYDEKGKLYAWENTILPDAFVRQDIEDIRQGKDSVIEWVLAQ